MARRPFRARTDRTPRYSADRVRGGEIVLRVRIERFIFVAGLAGAVVLAWLLSGP